MCILYQNGYNLWTNYDFKPLAISGGNTKYDFREALTPLWIGYARFLEIHRAVHQKHESLSGRCSMVSFSYLYSFEDFLCQASLCFATKLKRSLVNKCASFLFIFGISGSLRSKEVFRVR